MKDKFSVVTFTFDLLIFGCIIATGLASFGYVKSYDNRLIEVKGLSEKTVKADIGDMSISISNSGYANLEDLYKKRISDKEKVIDFLKKQGITDDEIVNFSMNTSDYNEEDKTTSASGITTIDRKKFFRSDDTINIKTTQLEKINEIKSEIVKLSSEGVLLTYNYSYKLTNFINVKLEMMKEASQNARKNAEAFVEPQGVKIGKVAYLRQGEITIRAEDESENVSSWDSQESQSINKKLRLVIRAGFTSNNKKE